MGIDRGEAGTRVNSRKEIGSLAVWNNRRTQPHFPHNSHCSANQCPPRFGQWRGSIVQAGFPQAQRCSALILAFLPSGTHQIHLTTFFSGFFSFSLKFVLTGGVVVSCFGWRSDLDWIQASFYFILYVSQRNEHLTDMIICFRSAFTIRREILRRSESMKYFTR